MKTVCDGCLLAAMKMGINDKCPFCRTPRPKDGAKSIALVQARVDKKDPEAIKFLGDQYLWGKRGLEKDTSRAVELWTEAAELGSAGAHHNLGRAYKDGLGVEQDAARVSGTTKRRLCWVMQEPGIILAVWKVRIGTGTAQSGVSRRDT